MHWISDIDSVNAEVRLYENLFTAYNPNEHSNFLDVLNKSAETIMSNCKVNK